MMMSFCKKSVHSFLALTNTKDNGTAAPPPDPSSSSPRCHGDITTTTTAGLGFFATSADILKPTNVLESAAVKSPPPPTTTFMPTAAATATTDDLSCAIKRDPGGIGFLDEIGGSIDGLTSCTESLGFESSDERRVDDEIDGIINANNKDSYSRRLKRMQAERREAKKFPPPISSLSQDGKPTFFLRSVRKDGRLELTQVKINRPETLLASRQGGRLRLHLICNDDDQDVQEKSDEEDEAEDTATEEEKEEKRVMQWKCPVTTNGGGGDGSSRCYGHSFHHHRRRHHDLHVWRQACVSTR